MVRPPRSLALVRPLMLAALAAALHTPAGATSYSLSTFVDDAIVNGNCTLREAIRAANANGSVDACPAGSGSDTITLPTGTYPFAGDETLANAGGLTIQSQTLNPFDVTIDLGNADRFLNLQGPGPYVLGGLAIANGLAPAGEPIGGAIYAGPGSLTIFNFRFLSNHAPGGGALFYASTQPGAKLVIHNGAFISNGVTGSILAPSSGGSAFISVESGADADLRDLSFLSGSLTASVFSLSGGALYLSSNQSGSVAACTRCNFQNNVVASTAPSGADMALGGAVYAASFAGARTELADCRFTGNSATGTAAAIKVSTIYSDASTGGTVALYRLFVDFNGGASDALTRDVELFSQDSASVVALVDSQITFGSANGLVATADAVAQILLGHLTIADYPLTGANLLVSGGTGVLLENSIVAMNGTNLTTGGKIGLVTNYVGNAPGFFNEPGGDYHLGGGSVAIDSGTNAAVSMYFADLDHHGRIVGAVTDRGCYEFDGLFADNFEVGDGGSWSAVVP